MSERSPFGERMEHLRRRLGEAGHDLALISDDDSVYYYTGYHDYLHMDFGRPTVLAVWRDGESVLITPSMELDMAEASAAVDRLAVWNDGLGDEWRGELARLVGKARQPAIEPERMPAVVRDFVVGIVGEGRLGDVSAIIAEQRMVKSAQELQMARHAGEVGMAMMQAAREALGDGVAEFEVALAISAAGARKAAALLQAHYDNDAMSPNSRFLQIMASGDEITKPHHRASTRVMRRGEPVFICLCGMSDFHRFKLGFDRTFWIGEIGDERQARMYEVAVESQRAALANLKPGVRAHDVHAAYAEVIEAAGFAYPFRCGRATGFSYLERPQLVYGDETVLEPGMVFALDGSVCEPGVFRAQVGDSFIVTEDGHEQITHHAKAIADMVV